MFSRPRGFTLIELLVVIAIIGLLASTVLVSLSNVRSNARDSQRLTQARELMKALEVYRTKNGEYPCSGTAIVCVTGANDYSLRAFLIRPVMYAYRSPIETTLRASFYAPASDPYGYTLIYRIRSVSASNQADPTSYTIVVGLENPISTATASTTAITVVGDTNGSDPDSGSSYTLQYCTITVGTPDTKSVMGAGAGIPFSVIGNCPISGVK